jgi:MFS family permease
MFPQLGAPIGFIFSAGIFLILGKTLSDRQFLAYGWRIPFIASAVLVWVGLYVRLKLTETPDFLKVMEKNERVRVPLVELFVRHVRPVLLGTAAAITTFLLFYLLTVFTLSWGTSMLHYPKTAFLIAQIISNLFFALGIPLSAKLAERYGPGGVLLVATAGIFIFGLFFSTLFVSGSLGMTVTFLSVGMFLMGLTYGPLGTALAEIFPAAVRYTGASLSFTLAGILGASLTPYLATTLAISHGLPAVGYYLAIAAVITFAALFIARPSMQGK